MSALLDHGYKSTAITERYVTATNPAALRPAADAIADELAQLLYNYGAITLEAARQIGTGYRGSRREWTRRSCERSRRAALSLADAAKGYLDDHAERAKHGASEAEKTKSIHPSAILAIACSP